MSRKKRTAAVVEVPIDEQIAEAKQMRADVQAQWPQVAALARYLGARHLLNGFGDELQLTWTPKEKHR